MEKHRRTIFAVLLIAIMLLPMGSMSGKGGDADIGSNIPSRAAPQYKGIKYAIITTEQLARSFEPLKEWRSQTGLRSEIFTIDGPGSVIEGIEGRDPAERLFNFISSLYEDSEGSLEYVLLGGDSDIIPVRYLHANASRWGYDDDYLSMSTIPPHRPPGTLTVTGYMVRERTSRHSVWRICPSLSRWEDFR